MKIVNKYILASCVFCYFAGIYMIADKVGFLRFADEYGIECNQKMIKKAAKISECL